MESGCKQIQSIHIDTGSVLLFLGLDLNIVEGVEIFFSCKSRELAITCMTISTLLQKYRKLCNYNIKSNITIKAFAVSYFKLI